MKKRRWIVTLALQALFSLAPALALCGARAFGGAVYAVCLYGAVPCLCGGCCYYASKKGIDPYASLWVPPAVCAAAYAALWQAAPHPGGIMLDILIGIPFAAAGSLRRAGKGGKWTRTANGKARGKTRGSSSKG